MTASALKPLAEQAFARYHLSAEARAVAWESCWLLAKDGTGYENPRARIAYMAISASLRPMMPTTVFSTKGD